MSDAPPALPRLRAVVLDARTAAEIAAAPLSFATVTTSTAFVELARLPGPYTREVVHGALGANAIVVVAGPRIAAIAREARILRAAGAAAAVIAIARNAAPAATANDDDTVERNVRHLLTGIGLSGDEATSAPFVVGEPMHEVAEALARVAVRTARDGFLVVARPHNRRGGAPLGRVIEGSLPSNVRAAVLGPAGLESRIVRRTGGSDDAVSLDIGPHGFKTDDDIVISNEPIPFARVFVVGDALSSSEPCIAFGGRGGWGSGTIHDGVIELDRPVCPKSGRIGVILFKGAGLGPVLVVNAHMLSGRPCTEDDFEAFFDLGRAAIKDAVIATYGAWDDADQRVRFRASFKPDAATLFFDDDNRLFAMIEIESGGDAVYVSRVYVHPRDQRQGVGRVLVGNVLSQARRDKRDVTLRVMKSNVRARRLYEKLGFVVDGETDTHFHMRARP